MGKFHTDEFGQSRDVTIKVTKETCGRAKWAMRFALLPIIPALPVLAMLTGWLALGSIRRNASLTGARRARWAIALGLACTAAQAFIGWQVWRYAETARTGPHAVLATASQGDVTGFMAQFETAIQANHEFATTFIEIINERYGSCGSTSLQLPSNWYMSWRPFAPFEYTAQFDRSIVPVTAQFIVEPSVTEFIWHPKLRYIEIHDPVEGDLRYPPDAGSMNQLAAYAGTND